MIHPSQITEAEKYMTLETRVERLEEEINLLKQLPGKQSPCEHEWMYFAGARVGKECKLCNKVVLDDVQPTPPKEESNKPDQLEKEYLEAYRSGLLVAEHKMKERFERAVKECYEFKIGENIIGHLRDSLFADKAPTNLRTGGKEESLADKFKALGEESFCTATEEDLAKIAEAHYAAKVLEAEERGRREEREKIEAHLNIVKRDVCQNSSAGRLMREIMQELFGK